MLVNLISSFSFQSLLSYSIYNCGPDTRYPLNGSRSKTSLHPDNFLRDPNAVALACPHSYPPLFRNQVFDIGPGYFIDAQDETEDPALSDLFECESVLELRIQSFRADTCDRACVKLPAFT